MPSKSATNNKEEAHGLILIHAILVSIRNALGRSLWTLYRQLMRNILRNWDGSAIGVLSARTLVALLEQRLDVAFRHNDIVRAMRGVHGAQIPAIEIGIDVHHEIKADYWRFSNATFGKGVCGLAKWIMLMEAGEMIAEPKSGKTKHAGLNSPFIPFFDGIEVLGDEVKEKKRSDSQKQKKVEMLGGQGTSVVLIEDVDTTKFACTLRDFLTGTKHSSDPISDDIIRSLLWEFRGALRVHDLKSQYARQLAAS